MTIIERPRSGAAPTASLPHSGHLWNNLLGLDVNPHFDPLHVLSNIFIIAGFIMLSSVWRALHQAQQTGELATDGLYARLRHPQYTTFIVIMFGFLLQWPTQPSVLMFPILVFVYTRLASAEERQSLVGFGDRYRVNVGHVPAFVLRFRLDEKTA